MIIVADSGSTKTDWALTGPGGIDFFHGTGLNPYFLTEAQLLEEIAFVLRNVDKNKVTGISFFGAGTTSEVNRQKLRNAFENLFPRTKDIVIESDLLGAAKALFNHEAGIACILGTGANSCVYDGEKIVEKVRSLGYFLGDNGSGAVIGLRFLQLYLRNKLPESMASEFADEFRLDYRYIMDNVYRRSTPGGFFAKFAPFILKHIDEPVVKKMVKDEFREFVEYFILGYKGYDKFSIRITGSIAYFFKDIADEVFSEYGITTDRVIKKPIEALAKYYSEFV